MQKRLDGLDGMRGIAALIVVLHHLAPLMHVTLFKSGYLAVDFFFMLSGYVLSRTYDERLQSGLTPAKFMSIRLKRLYPMMALGILGGAALSAQDMAPNILAVRLIAQMLFVPLVVGAVPLFPLNGVQWSLALELLANLFHATFLKSLGWQWLVLIVAVSLGLLGLASSHYGSLAIGDRSSNIIGGVPRLLFSYVAGCLLYRGVAGDVFGGPRFRGWLIALLPASLIFAGVATTFWPAWLIDVAIVALVMPPIVLIGAHVELSGLWRQIARNGGRISYPLYALHIPLIGATLLMSGPPSLRYPLSGLVAILGSWLAANRLELVAQASPGQSSFRPDAV